jgi:hypothetical protein
MRGLTLGLLVGTIAACSQTPVILLEIATPPGEDTFAGVTLLRARNLTPASEVAVAFAAGVPQTLDLTIAAGGGETQIEVDGLDATGAVLAHGRTPPFIPQAASTYLRIYLARVGAFGRAPLPAGTEPSVRRDAAVTGLAGLGALAAGGRDASDLPVADGWIYDDFLHLTVAIGALTQARSGAAALDLGGGSALVFGGLAAAGPSSLLESFDPSAGSAGTFVTLFSDGDAAVARAHAPAVFLGRDVLAVGGLGAGEAPLASAAVIVLDVPASVEVPPGALAGGRVGHTLTPTSDGAQALVYGLPVGDTGIVAEVYRPTEQVFAALPDLGPALGRSGHTATPLADGRTLIVGGSDPAGTLTGDVIEIAADLGAATLHAGALARPRAGHTATLLGASLLIAGGAGPDGVAPDAELLDVASLAVLARPALQSPRTGHAAVALGSGTVLLVGGTDGSGAAVPSLELYTPAP